MPHCGYASGLKWNLDPADPTENLSPGYGLDWGKRSTLFLWMWKTKLYFSLVLSFLISDFILCIYWTVVFRNTKWLSLPWVVAVCRHSGGVPQSPDCWSFCYVQGKMRASEVDDDRGMVSDADGVWDLGREDVELLERQDFCLCGCGIDGNGGSSSVDGSIGSGVFWSSGGVLWWKETSLCWVGFCGGGGSGAGDEVRCKASLVMFKWEGGFFVMF